jgi:hypothetical protein
MYDELISYDARRLGTRFDVPSSSSRGKVT